MGNDAFVNTVINQINSNIALLESEGLLSSDDAQLIKTRLPVQRNGHFQPASLGPNGGASSGSRDLDEKSPVGGSSFTPNMQVSRPVPGPPAKMKKVKALWDYTSQNPDDLNFREGDIINVDDELNQDWWSGSLNGRKGLFPSSYVEKYDPSTSRPVPPPPSQDAKQFSAPDGPPPSQGGYYPPPPPSMYGQGPYPPPQPYQQPYAPQPYQQPPYQAPPQQPVVVQQPASSSNGGGFFKGNFGSSLVTGLGFGAGSAVASDLINDIF